jgi:hypothetical protein
VARAIQSHVNAYQGMFLSAVTRGRQVWSDEVARTFGRGRMVSADEVVARGRVDRVRTLDEIVADLGSPRLLSRHQIAIDPHSPAMPRLERPVEVFTLRDTRAVTSLTIRSGLELWCFIDGALRATRTRRCQQFSKRRDIRLRGAPKFAATGGL